MSSRKSENNKIINTSNSNNDNRINLEVTKKSFNISYTTNSNKYYIQEFTTMKKCIANIFILFFVLFGISANALAQDDVCPDREFVCNLNIDSLNNGLEDEARIMESYTGYNTPDEAQSHCEQMIKEKTAKVDEFHIDDYDGSVSKIKREIDETRVFLEQQTLVCNDCLASKIEAYEKKFIKKHGDHRYNTKGYRTKVVVVWGEAERIPTDAQAKYDLLYDEYMSDYEPSNDRHNCLENTPACKDVGEAEAKISSLKRQISELRERHNNEVSAQNSLKQTTELCDSVSKSIEKYNTKLKHLAFLKTCKYPEESEATSTNTSAGIHQNINMNNLQQANKAINKARSVGRVFGF